MILDKIVFQSAPPSQISTMWAKPINGGFTIYIFNNGRWQPIKLINDGGTITTDDDVVISGNGTITDSTASQLMEQIEEIKGTANTTSEIDSQKEMSDFLEGYSNTDKLSEVIAGATSKATEEEVKALFQ